MEKLSTISVVVNPEFENVISPSIKGRISSFTVKVAEEDSKDIAGVREKEMGVFSSGFFVLLIQLLGEYLHVFQVWKLILQKNF